MINANIKDFFDSTTDDDIEIKKNNNDIYFYILISFIVFFLQIKTLITQYIFIVSLLFLFLPKTGILFASILFFFYNYKQFNNNMFIKCIVLTNIIVSISFIALDNIMGNNQHSFISIFVMNIIAILSNIYCIFVITKAQDKDEEKGKGGGININKIDLNYRN